MVEFLRSKFTNIRVYNVGDDVYEGHRECHSALVARLWRVTAGWLDNLVVLNGLEAAIIRLAGEFLCDLMRLSFE